MQQTKIQTSSPKEITSYHLESATYWCDELSLGEEESGNILLEVLNMMVTKEMFELLLNAPSKINIK